MEGEYLVHFIPELSSNTHSWRPGLASQSSILTWVFGKSHLDTVLYYYELPAFGINRVYVPDGEKPSLKLGYSLPA